MAKRYGVIYVDLDDEGKGHLNVIKRFFRLLRKRDSYKWKRILIEIRISENNPAILQGDV